MAVYFILTLVFTTVTALLGGLLCRAVGRIMDRPAASRPSKGSPWRDPVHDNRAA